MGAIEENAICVWFENTTRREHVFELPTIRQKRLVITRPR